MAQVLASAARTATTTANMVGYSSSRAAPLMLIIDVTAITTSTITPSVQLYDDTLSTYFDFVTMGAISGTGTYIYIIREGEASAASPVTEVHERKFPASDQMRLSIVHGDASSWTYSATVLWYPPE